ncbi:MAG: hypothetical protein OXD01_11865 [Gammaproteobacteria bacterium]|nr:hypothetical protein [Gammaproteobacteria bacterium]
MTDCSKRFRLLVNSKTTPRTSGLQANNSDSFVGDEAPTLVAGFNTDNTALTGRQCDLTLNTITLGISRLPTEHQ